mgnify:CR=1 FL=1
MGQKSRFNIAFDLFIAFGVFWVVIIAVAGFIGLIHTGTALIEENLSVLFSQPSH